MDDKDHDIHSMHQFSLATASSAQQAPRPSPPLKRKRSAGHDHCLSESPPAIPEDLPIDLPSNATLAIHSAIHQIKSSEVNPPRNGLVGGDDQQHPSASNSSTTLDGQAQDQDIDMSSSPGSAIVLVLPNSDDEAAEDQAQPEIISIDQDDQGSVLHTRNPPHLIFAQLCRPFTSFETQPPTVVEQLTQMVHHYQTAEIANVDFLSDVIEWLGWQCPYLSDTSCDWIGVFLSQDSALVKGLTRLILAIAYRNRRYASSKNDDPDSILAYLVEAFTCWLTGLVRIVIRSDFTDLIANFSSLCADPFYALHEATCWLSSEPLARRPHADPRIDGSRICRTIAAQLCRSEAIADMAGLMSRLIQAGVSGPNQLRFLGSALHFAVRSTPSAVGSESAKELCFELLVPIPEQLNKILMNHVEKETVDSSQAARMGLVDLCVSISSLVGTSLSKIVQAEAEAQAAISENANLCATFDWLVRICREYIGKGYLTLRVAALERLSAELVLISNKVPVGIRDHPHSIHAYVAQSLLREGLLDMTIGPDAHVELINRAANVSLFFLCTRQFTQEVSDLHWRTTTATGQDQQVAAALSNFIRVVEYETGSKMKSDNLITICNSLLTQPLPKVTPLFIELIRLLNTGALARADEELPPHRCGDAYMNLQISLIQAALTATSPLDIHLRDQAMQTLGALGKFQVKFLNVYDSPLRKIIEQCIGAIATASVKSEASILALLALCQTSPVIRNFVRDETDSLLVLEEAIQRTISVCRNSVTIPSSLSYELHLDLLLLLISQPNNGLEKNAGLVEILQSLFESETLTILRDPTWTRLSCLIDSQFCGRLRPSSDTDAPSVNPAISFSVPAEKVFVDPADLEAAMIQGFVDLLPKLLGKENAISAGLIDFVKTLVKYQLHKTGNAHLDMDDALEIPSITLLWQCIGIAPTGALISLSYQYLIEILSDPHTFRIAAVERSRERSVIDSTYRVMAERCLSGLEDVFRAGQRCEIEFSDSRQFCNKFERILGFMRSFIHYQSRMAPPDSQHVHQRAGLMNKREFLGDPVKVDCEVTYVGYLSHASMCMTFPLRMGEYETQYHLFLRLAFVLNSTNLEITREHQERIPARPMRVLRSGSQEAIKVQIRVKPMMTGVWTAFGKYLTDNKSRLNVFLDSEVNEGRFSLATFDFLTSFEKCRPGSEHAGTMISSIFTSFDQPFRSLMSLNRLRYVIDTLEIGQLHFDESHETQQHKLDPLVRETTELAVQGSDGTAASEADTSGISSVSRAEFERDAVKLLENLLSDARLSEPETTVAIKLRRTAANCLSALLRIAKNKEIGSSLTNERKTLVTQLLSWCKRPNIAENTADDGIAPYYELLMAISMSSKTIENQFSYGPDVSAFHSELLFKGHNLLQTAKVCDLIATHLCWKEFAATDHACGPARGIKPREALRFFWRTLADGIEQRDISDCSLEALRMMVELTDWYIEEQMETTKVDMHHYLSPWFNALVRQKRLKSTDLRASDGHLACLVTILEQCFNYMSPDIVEKHVDLPELIDQLYSKYLSNRQSFNINGDTDPELPICAVEDRSAIYKMLQPLASRSTSILLQLIELEEEPLSHMGAGLKDCVLDESYLLRSEIGYVGLRNLSMTCYQNALTMQLFMNPKLRKFLMSAASLPNATNFDLLLQLQRCFAYLQESVRRSFDTQTLAPCIKGMDGNSIPVEEQMDVQEFYNLILDQLEFQLPIEAGKRLRTFFGGVQVSRIESRDCKHISQREEAFSNIQCALDGADSLAQSLSNLVQGEQMEGDNKYKCESCNALVNATKRTTFRDLPDDIVFHLMRFRYDIETQWKMKNCDFFSFPMTIDMNLYTYAFLTNAPSQPDIFELKGAIMHAGDTAERGHYISFVELEPATNGHPAVWGEFDDELVREFDPANMSAELFGGLGSDRRMKTRSAYMLFYRRASSVPENSAAAVSQRERSKAHIPKDLMQQITSDNADVSREFGFLSLPYRGHIWTLLNLAAETTDKTVRYNAALLLCGYTIQVLKRQDISNNVLERKIERFRNELSKNDPLCCLIKTVREWTDTFLQDLDTYNCNLFARFVKKLLNKMWLNDDDTLAEDARDILAAIRSIFDVCCTEARTIYDDTLRSTPVREDVQAFYQVMRMCIDNLELVAESADILTEDCKDVGGDEVRLESWKDHCRVFDRLPRKRQNQNYILSGDTSSELSSSEEWVTDDVDAV